MAIVGTADGSYVGTFTIASKPAANQFTYAQSGADSSTSGGNAWHAVLDAQDSANSVTWVAVGTANWARFANFVGHGGTSGGMLSIVDSVYSTGIFQTNLTNWPYNGDIINCGFQSDCGFVGRQFVLTQSTGHPPPNQPRVDLATVGNAARFFKCVGCRGLAADNVSVGVAQGSGTQLTYVDIDNAGVLSIAGAPSPGFGSYYVNALVNGDSAGLDTFRHDIVGKLREFGGPLTVNQLSPPSSVFALSCTTGDTHTYTYEVTAKSGSGETLGSSEASVSSCNAVNVNHPITGRFRPVLGADAYNVYRTAVDGGSGTEKLAVTVAQNSEDGTGAVWSFTDTTTDTNLGAVLPTANTTGNATAGGVLAAGASAAAGAAAGDLSAARDASSGALWLGSNGSQSVDFGITNAGAFSLLGGGLFTPSLSINDAGQLFMGRTTVGSLPTCNTANKFSWLVVTNNNVACAYGNAPAGGGTIACPVFCDGAAWKIH